MLANTLKNLGRSRANITLSSLLKKSWTNNNHLNGNNKCRNIVFLVQPEVNWYIFLWKSIIFPKSKTCAVE